MFVLELYELVPSRRTLVLTLVACAASLVIPVSAFFRLRVLAAPLLVPVACAGVAISLVLAIRLQRSVPKDYEQRRRVTFSSIGFDAPRGSRVSLDGKAFTLDDLCALEERFQTPKRITQCDTASGAIGLSWRSFRAATLERGEGDSYRLALRYAHSRDAELSLGWFRSAPERAAWLEQELNRRILAMRA